MRKISDKHVAALTARHLEDLSDPLYQVMQYVVKYGLQAAKLAKLAGVSTATVHMWVQSKYPVRVTAAAKAKLEKLSRALREAAVRGDLDKPDWDQHVQVEPDGQ